MIGAVVRLIVAIGLLGFLAGLAYAGAAALFHNVVTMWAARIAASWIIIALSRKAYPENASSGPKARIAVDYLP